MKPGRLLSSDPGPPLGHTRADVLALLKAAESPLGVRDVAQRVGLHTNTARFHLEALVKLGLATRQRQERETPGRPRIAYLASGGAGADGQRRYRLLAEILTSMVAGVLPEPGMAAAEAGREWGRYLTEQPAPYQRAKPADALAKLTDMLAEIGFAPESVAVGTGYQLRLRECPFREVAERHQDVVCSLHLGLMQGALSQLRAPLGVDRLAPFVEPRLCMAYLSSEPESGRARLAVSRDGQSP